MNLSSLNVDVLLYLIRFVHPVDRFNLVLSGILKGFENVNKGMDLNKRIEYFKVQLGLRRDSICELEIRSLKFLDLRNYIKGASYCSRKIFERLVEGGFLENNRQLVASYFWHDDIPQLLQETCSMKKLQKLNLLNCDLELAQLSGVFWSCPELTELHLTCNELWVSEMLKMDGHLIKDLRRGFQTLRHFEIECQNSDNLLPVIQQILTWLKECVHLGVRNNNRCLTRQNIATNQSLKLDPTLAQNLRSLTLMNASPGFHKWLRTTCRNIQNLKIKSTATQWSDKGVDVDLRKKELQLTGQTAREFKKFFRCKCKVQILRVSVLEASLQDFVDLELAENFTEVHLSWGSGPSVEEVLPVIKRWRHLRRLTLYTRNGLSVPQFEVVCSFIMELKHLIYLHLIPDFNSCNRDELETLRDKVNQSILPQRPNFEFDISRTRLWFLDQ